jgi:serpin B
LAKLDTNQRNSRRPQNFDAHPCRPLKTLEVSLSTTDRLVAANTRFGFKLFSEIAKQDAGKNVFLSPFSVAMALAMTYNGACGKTQRAMADALELQGMSLQEINEANAALRAAMESIDPQVQLAVANSLWLKQGEMFKLEFIKRNRDFYAAEASNLPDDPIVINAWVSAKTGGKIKDIIDHIDPLTILILLNAIYFKGKWAVQFDKTITQNGTFTLSDGTHIKHPMMFQSGRYMYYRGKGFQAVSLPYSTGRVSMYIFLPEQDSSLTEFQKSLTGVHWDKWMSRFCETKGDIVLPRFQVRYEIKLNDALIALGMASAFSKDHADFRNMCPIPPTPNVYIALVKHKTFVEVNEDGTEAAAATAVVMKALGTFQEERFHMIIDRPFFCAIRDNETGTLLFMGSIVDPQ